jgi:hypothetical protein
MSLSTQTQMHVEGYNTTCAEQSLVNNETSTHDETQDACLRTS